jgi:hypothetical protein
MMYGRPKGKDQHVQNEGREPKKGLSKTEIQQMMRKMMGGGEPATGFSDMPLMPNMKKRGGSVR